MAETLKLSDVIARNVIVEWYEGVALLRALTDVVTDQFDGSGVPDLSEVELAADGTIRAAGAMDTREPVRRLGQLLQAVLTQSDPPVQLRLVISQATAPMPVFRSVHELSDALGYFERPDRTGVLRRLFARASSAPEVWTSTTPSVDRIAPLPSEEPAGTEESARGHVFRRRAVAVLIIGIVLVGCFWFFTTFGLGAGGNQVAKIAVRASDAVGGTVVSGISKVSEGVGLGRLAPADSNSPAPAAPPQPVPAPSRSVANGIRKGPRTAVPDRPVLAFDLEGAFAAPGGSTPIRETELEPSGTVVARDVTPDGVVYSAADPGVVPPVGVRPQLPKGLPPNVNKDQLGRIELIVLPDGTVGSVKLLGPSRGVPEAMLLSAAKAWTFEPAQVNGRPVSYRKVVWLMLQ